MQICYELLNDQPNKVSIVLWEKYRRKNATRVIFVLITVRKKGQSRIDNPESQATNIGHRNSDNILYILKKPKKLVTYYPLLLV
jgi:hypothetical protein